MFWRRLEVDEVALLCRRPIPVADIDHFVAVGNMLRRGVEEVSEDVVLWRLHVVEVVGNGGVAVTL